MAFVRSFLLCLCLYSITGLADAVSEHASFSELYFQGANGNPYGSSPQNIGTVNGIGELKAPPLEQNNPKNGGSGSGSGQPTASAPSGGGGGGSPAAGGDDPNKKGAGGGSSGGGGGGKKAGEGDKELSSQYRFFKSMLENPQFDGAYEMAAKFFGNAYKDASQEQKDQIKKILREQSESVSGKLEGLNKIQESLRTTEDKTSLRDFQQKKKILDSAIEKIASSSSESSQSS